MESKRVSENSNFKAPQSLSIDMRNLFYTIPGRKKEDPNIEILKSISSYFKAGEVTGILGPVGAGKTSLLNCLSKRARTGVKGEIDINGEPLQNKHKKLMGYVLQKDYLFSEMNVQDSLLYTAALRRGDLNLQERKDLIDEILDLMRLTSTKATRIGDPFNHGVSGGELKRVNISTELISNPSIFFLDEPTSGLDSSSAVAILDTLNQLTRAFNMNVILSIHQPSSQAYAMLDRIIIMNEGEFVYQGKANKLYEYLEFIGYSIPWGWNVSDYIMELLDDPSAFTNMKRRYNQFIARNSEGSYYMAIHDKRSIPSNLNTTSASDSGEHINAEIISNQDQIAKKSNSKPEMSTREYPPNLKSIVATELPNKKLMLDNFKSPSWLESLYWLVLRGFKKDSKGETPYYVILQTVVMAIVIGALWWQALSKYTEDRLEDRIGYLFFSINQFMFIPAFIALLTFLNERVIISKERASKTYRVSPYLFSKTISDVAIFSLTPTLYMLITFPMTGIHFNATQIFGIWGCFMMTLFVAHSLGMAISSSVTRYDVGSLLLTVFLLACMLTGGFFVAHESVPSWLSWIRWLSVINYSISLCLYINFNGYYFECSETTRHEVCPIPGSELMDGYATGLGPGGDILALMVLWTVSKAITYAFLRWGKQLRMA